MILLVQLFLYHQQPILSTSPIFIYRYINEWNLFYKILIYNIDYRVSLRTAQEQTMLLISNYWFHIHRLIKTYPIQLLIHNCLPNKQASSYYFLVFVIFCDKYVNTNLFPISSKVTTAPRQRLMRTEQRNQLNI